MKNTKHFIYDEIRYLKYERIIIFFMFLFIISCFGIGAIILWIVYNFVKYKIDENEIINRRHNKKTIITNKIIELNKIENMTKKDAEILKKYPHLIIVDRNDGGAIFDDSKRYIL